MTFTRKGLFMGVFFSLLSTCRAPFGHKYPHPIRFLTKKVIYIPRHEHYIPCLKGFIPSTGNKYGAGYCGYLEHCHSKPQNQLEKAVDTRQLFS